MSWHFLMKIQGRKWKCKDRKGKCKDNIKSYSLDRFDQVERSKKMLLQKVFHPIAWLCIVSKHISLATNISKPDETEVWKKLESDNQSNKMICFSFVRLDSHHSMLRVKLYKVIFLFKNQDSMNFSYYIHSRVLLLSQLCKYQLFPQIFNCCL